VPRACRPYRAKTKGKVERENREVQQSNFCWLTDQVKPPRGGVLGRVLSSGV
jgi:hypothetical protein